MEKPRPENEAASPTDLIMPYAEYAKVRHNLPYIYEIEHGGKRITYFGACHTNDPEDPMFTEIERMIKKVKPDLVMIEGRTQLNESEARIKDHLQKTDRQTTISVGGEPDYTIKLATEVGAEVTCPEPDLLEEIRFLLDSGFDKDTIFAYYVTRRMTGFARVKEKTSEADFLKRSIKGFQEQTNWQDFDYSPDHLEAVQKQIWGSKVDYLSDFSYRFWPVPFGKAEADWSLSNMLSQKSSRFRDETIVRNIEEAAKTYDSIFIVYGASHAVMEESAVRSIVENSNENSNS